MRNTITQTGAFIFPISKYPKYLFLFLGCTFLLYGCAGAPNYSYDRVPEGEEIITRPPEIEEVDNCESDLLVEKTVSRTVSFVETVTLDREEVNSALIQAGVGAGIEGLEASVLGEIKNEVTDKYGAGLESGQARTETIMVQVKPKRKAIVTLNWIETWEFGYFSVAKDGKAVGNVSYRLLKDVQLSTSHIRSINCGWWGQPQKSLITFWYITAPKMFQQGINTWPFHHLEVTVPTILFFTLLGSLTSRKMRRPIHSSDEGLPDPWDT